MLATLRCVKAELSATTTPEPETPAPEADEKLATKPCPIHPYDLMYRRPSKHGGHFYSHRLEDETWCNGRAKA